jgi:acyl-CoA reductase-like NAD-dependent aldehyde dehydrogenase
MAGSRLLVQREVHDDLVGRIAARARQIRLGDPALAETEMGPLANEPQFRKVLRLLEKAGEQGAVAVTGGVPDAERGGYFVQPTVLTNVTPDMVIAREEVFGPVLSVIPFDSEEEAIALANDSAYGLSGSIYTQDLGRALRVSRGVQTGNLSVNSHASVRYWTPFGGYKMSGLGRELGPDAPYAFTEEKNVFIAH